MGMVWGIGTLSLIVLARGDYEEAETLKQEAILIAREMGNQWAIAKDMGYTNVSRLEGGTVAWKEAGYPTNPVK